MIRLVNSVAMWYDSTLLGHAFFTPKVFLHEKLYTQVYIIYGMMHAARLLCVVRKRSIHTILMQNFKS